MSDTTTPIDPVILTRDGAVAILSLNRPAALNALDIPCAQALLRACQSLKEDDSVRAVVLRGNGRNFGAGGDLASLQHNAADTAHQLIGHMHEVVEIFAALNAPVIASVHGAVAGGSLSLMMACDLAIAADTARFNLAYANVGASCDVSGSWHLPRLVGLRNAMQIALLADTFDAAEALRLGLVNRVVPAATLEAETQTLAQRLANGPTLAYGRMKRLLRQSFDHTLPHQLELERDNFKASTQTQDFQDAVRAFLSKQTPVFQGR